MYKIVINQKKNKELRPFRRKKYRKDMIISKIKSLRLYNIMEQLMN